MTRKLVYALFVSLDGYVEDSNGSLEWASIDEEIHFHANQGEETYDTVLYGRRMYETMSGYWPAAADDPDASPAILDYARIYKAMPRVVFSSTLEQVAPGETLIRTRDPEKVAEEVARLKAQPAGKIGGKIAVGGPTIAADLIRRGMVDEYHLYLQPVVLGAGKRMFPPGVTLTGLRLLELQRFQSGAVFLRYEV